jgi:peptide/nickel transport system substrate-binding protein
VAGSPYHLCPRSKIVPSGKFNRSVRGTQGGKVEKKHGVQGWVLFVIVGALALAAGLVFAAPGGQPALAMGPAIVEMQQDASLPTSLQAAAPYTTLVDVQIDAPTTLDPHWLYDTASQRAVAQVYETLLMQKREDPAAYIPLLATGWTISADAQIYTFTIRSGVGFHEGGTLEPHDVAYSFWRGLLQDRDSGPAWTLLWPLLSVNAVDEIPGDDLAKCQVVKDAITYSDAGGTVTFHLDRPFSPFLDILAYTLGSVLDQEWMAANGGWAGDCANWRDYYNPPAGDSILYDQMNGTGPFRLVHWTAGEVELARYDGYWRQEPAWPGGPNGLAALETVRLQFVPDWDTRRDMLISGEADTIYVPGTNITELNPLVWGIYEGPEDQVPTLVNPQTGILRLFKDLPQSTQTPLLFCYAVNTDTNPYIGSGALDGDGIPPDFFTDLHVRKAFNYAMDWTVVISEVYGGEAIQSRGPIPEGMLGYNDLQPVYAHSPSSGTVEFQQAWGGDVWTQGFSFTVAYNEGNVPWQRMLETLAQNLAAINPAFRVNVISLPLPDLYGAVFTKRIPMFPAGWSEDYHHPHDWVQPYLHSSGSFGWYQTFPAAMAAPFDLKVDECVELTDPAAAQTCYEELQNMSYMEAAAMWGVQPIGRHYERTEVRGYYFNPARQIYYYALSKGVPPSVVYLPVILRNSVP